MRNEGEWRELRSQEIFSHKKVVVFALPGAFTPTCSSAHVPRYNELLPEFRRRGVDRVVCVAVNDAFVMEQWAREQNAPDILFLPDGNGEFAEKMGMLVDKSSLGFGKRSWRYSMLVDDGVIQKMYIEPELEGDPFQVSDAETMLRALAPDARPPPDIVLFTKPSCGHCARARTLLRDTGLPFEEISATPRKLRAVSGRATTPQVFVDGKHIGGADELEAFLGTLAASGRVRPDQPDENA